MYDLPICNPTCDSFSLMEAGVGGFEGTQRESCSTFFGSGCALYTDLWTRFFIDTNTPPPPPPMPPRPPFGSQTMQELMPTRIFFDGGMAQQMRDELNILEEEQQGMTGDQFGSVTTNRLYDGTGTTPIRPTARWELRLDPTFSSACNASDLDYDKSRTFANVVADFTNAPLERGLVSKYPQTAEFGCEVWRFSVRWDMASAQCLLRIRLRDSRVCKAPLNATENTFEGLIQDYLDTKNGEPLDVLFEAAIPRFEAEAPNSVIVRIKDPSIDTAKLATPHGPAVVDTADGTEFEVYWNGAKVEDRASVAAGAYSNLVVPNVFLPDGLTDVYLYTAYAAFFATDNTTTVAGDRTAKLIYSYDIVFASGRRTQEVVESHKYITASSDTRVLCACTDGVADTPCLSAGSENAWIKFDLGTASHVKGIELVAWRDMASPAPPPAPPPRLPPSPPPSPPHPPPPPIGSPSPRPPPRPPFCNYVSENNCTVNFIDHTNDGVCDGMLRTCTRTHSPCLATSVDPFACARRRRVGRGKLRSSGRRDVHLSTRDGLQRLRRAMQGFPTAASASAAATAGSTGDPAAAAVQLQPLRAHAVDGGGAGAVRQPITGRAVVLRVQRRQDVSHRRLHPQHTRVAARDGDVVGSLDAVSELRLGHCWTCKRTIGKRMP